MLKNKKILIILLLVGVLLISSTSCFAIDTNNVTDTFDLTFTYKEEEFVLNNIPRVSKYYIIQKWDYDKDWNIIFFDSRVDKIILNEDNSVSIFDSNNNSVSTMSCYKCDFGSNSWTLKKSASVDANFVYNCAYATCNVLDYQGNIFFQVPPLTHLAQIVEEAKAEETTREIIKILPLTLVAVVSFLGLRKGLKLLSELLHRCLIT